MPNTLEGYRTQSLYEASFLLTRGFKLAGKERFGEKVTLIFEPDPRIDEAVLEFHNGGQAEASKLFDVFRRLKDLIFQRA